MYMSFADEYDAVTGAMPKVAQTVALAAPAVPAVSTKTELKQVFTHETRAQAAATRRHNGATEDGALGGFILDSLFTAAFPGIGAILQVASLGTGDAVELYDQTRAAFAKSNKNALAARRPLTGGKVLMAPTPMMMGQMPVYARARKKGLLAMTLG